MYATETMRPIADALELLKEASAILEANANAPQNYNAIYANDFELHAWEIYKHMCDIRSISNRYGVR